MEKKETRQQQQTGIWWEVLQDCLPMCAGYIPFGLTCGIMGRTAGLSTFEITFMSAAVYAGASQFIALGMLASGTAGWGLIVLTTLLVNLRHLLMGAYMVPHHLKLPRPLGYYLAFGLTDESYALVASRSDRKGYDALYNWGVNTLLYLIWILATFLGALFYQSIPDPLEWGIDFALPATFLTLLIPRLTNGTALVVALVAALCAVLGALYLPGSWYIIVAAVAATLVGGMMERSNTHER
ncbi:MAG TPA: AzlC family ABC transporter permease [Firmicutes bacterium]|nr:AzlC family ABC transporter permease [Bacillota bacterium]